jgi:hypothetical protein
MPRFAVYDHTKLFKLCRQHLSHSHRHHCHPSKLHFCGLLRKTDNHQKKNENSIVMLCTGDGDPFVRQTHATFEEGEGEDVRDKGGG